MTNSLIVLALVGLVTSLVVHLSTFLGFNPQSLTPSVWLLHLGVFVVFVPTIILQNGLAKISGLTVAESQRKFVPTWLYFLAGAFFVYALFNFFYCTIELNEGGVPAKIDGNLVLHSHGHIIRKLTPQEFDVHEAYVTRGFSGHWMLFYTVSLMLLVAYKRAMKSAKNPEVEFRTEK